MQTLVGDIEKKLTLKTAYTPKLSNANCQCDIETQANNYADWIINRELSTADAKILAVLKFYPLKKTPNAHANQFRRYTLARLTGLDKEPGYKDGHDSKRHLARLTAGAIAMGFTIEEIEPEYNNK